LGEGSLDGLTGGTVIERQERVTDPEVARETRLRELRRPGGEGPILGQGSRDEGPGMKAVLDGLGDPLSGDGVDPGGLARQHDAAFGHDGGWLVASLGVALVLEGPGIEPLRHEALGEEFGPVDPVVAGLQMVDAATDLLATVDPRRKVPGVALDSRVGGVEVEEVPRAIA